MAQLQSDLIAQLQRAVDDLDRMLGELQLGTRNVEQLHDIEERVQHIATRLVQSVRGPDARPSAAPIRHRGGKAWF